MSERRRWLGARPRPARQRLLPFRARASRLERRFKAATALLTALVLGSLVAGTTTGRDAARAAANGASDWARRQAGLPPGREHVDAAWDRKRARDVRLARRGLEDLYETATPELRRLFDVAGMSPRDALLRPGNYDRVLLISSKVFAPDDRGRSYRLRPRARSVWVRQITPRKGPHALFLVPDTAEVRAAATAAGGIVDDGSAQTTNTWGLRGPEPDPSAEVRGIVLGDSFMQGLFVGDDQTPSIQLERTLARELNTTVSVLNTGHLGYSPEQYAATLREYGERFKPAFVVVALFANDFGDIQEVLRGRGDWEEAHYWLSEILRYCRGRDIICLMTTVPEESQLHSRRREESYPGKVSSVCDTNSTCFLNPLDAFIDEDLRLRIATNRVASPLYNLPIGDRHLSAKGAELWGRVVGRRLALLVRFRRAPLQEARAFEAR